jgi:hypothetical protein
MVHSRARRRMTRGLKRKPMALIKRLRKAKKGEYIQLSHVLISIACMQYRCACSSSSIYAVQ